MSKYTEPQGRSLTHVKMPKSKAQSIAAVDLKATTTQQLCPAGRLVHQKPESLLGAVVEKMTVPTPISKLPADHQFIFVQWRAGASFCQSMPNARQTRQPLLVRLALVFPSRPELVRQHQRLTGALQYRSGYIDTVERC